MADTYSADDWGRVRWALRTYGGPLGRELADHDDYSGGKAPSSSASPQGGEQSQQEGQQPA